MSALLLLCLSAAVAVSDALMFYLPPGTEKCFSDEYAFDVLVSGEFRVTTPGQEKTKKFSLVVRAPGPSARHQASHKRRRQKLIFFFFFLKRSPTATTTSCTTTKV